MIPNASALCISCSDIILKNRYIVEVIALQSIIYYISLIGCNDRPIREIYIPGCARHKFGRLFFQQVMLVSSPLARPPAVSVDELRTWLACQLGWLPIALRADHLALYWDWVDVKTTLSRPLDLLPYSLTLILSVKFLHKYILHYSNKFEFTSLHLF